ncbi:MAG TPA: DUF1223 domain-containing protein, partial [Vicinamibacterales bacterium]|nr:DUF1223 domain-containing protein [Vicinamibacterales bacterium]
MVRTLALAAVIVGVANPVSPVIARHVVLAELFTSEGCSSCPPADRLLQTIAATSPVPGVEVIGLEEHVDYWDRLGWRDPFSSSAFTDRQSEYAHRVFRSTQIYTPQLVVDGAFEAVGSDGASTRAAIADAAAQPAAAVVVHASAVGDRANVDVAVDASRIHRDEVGDIVVAVVGDGLVSVVRAGENGGRTLVHGGIVRSLITIGSIPGNTAQ